MKTCIWFGTVNVLSLKSDVNLCKCPITMKCLKIKNVCVKCEELEGGDEKNSGRGKKPNLTGGKLSCPLSEGSVGTPVCQHLKAESTAETSHFPLRT